MIYDRPEDCSWFAFRDEPLLSGFYSPFVVTKKDSPDDKWHLFAHSFLGIVSFVSDNGYDWKKCKLISFKESNCFLYKEDGVFYLLSVKCIDKKHSEILIRTSCDLVKWSRAKVLLKSRDLLLQIITKPQLFKVENKYRLYFGYEDSVTFAQADSITGDYSFFREEKPVIKLENSEEFNLVFCGDSFYAFKGKGSITIYKSFDGISFTIARKTPVLKMADTGWASNCISGCNTVYLEDEKCWYCYFGMGKAIGLLIGSLPAVLPATESKRRGIFQR